MNVAEAKKIHFIGIGGIGISALAKIMQVLGKTISGSDLVNSEIITEFKKHGVTIAIGNHQASHLQTDTDLVVYTNAMKMTNPEFKRAQKLKIPTMSYPQCLGEVIKGYLQLVVAGTHGKSTTTAMLAKIFMTAGLQPSVVVGTKIKECDNGNARFDLGRHFIIEGDEYKEAFLNYRPVGLIITNIEADHLDYYKTEENIVTAFKKLVKKIPRSGFLIANADDANVKKVIKQASCRVITFGLESGDYQAAHIIRHGEVTSFAVKGLEQFDLAIRVPGVHNVKNALAACVMALSFGVRHEIIPRALLEYNGAWRRFEVKGEKRNIVVVDDYAHHPTEIRATLASVRQYFPQRRVWCIFQPHSLDRTRRLFKDFVQSFQDCDKLVLTKIYRAAGREGNSKISSRDLAAAIKKTKKDVTFVNNLREIATTIDKRLEPGDVVITMGAGDITTVSDDLLQQLSR